MITTDGADDKVNAGAIADMRYASDVGHDSANDPDGATW